MSGTKQFRHSQLAMLGKVLRKGELDYHYRSVAMADGSEGLFYGDEGDGPENPVLLILDYLMQQGETVQYYVRPNAKGDGNIMWINIDKKDAGNRLAKFQANQANGTVVTPPPPTQQTETPGVITPPTQKVDPPPAQKVDPPAAKENPGVISPPSPQDTKKVETKVDPPVTQTQPPKQEVPFPTQPPPVQTKSGGRTPLDDPYYGYGSRNAMLDAKDNYFRWLEGYKMHRDEITDREFSFRYFFERALDIVKETGKNLQPSDLRKTAWTLAIEMYNEYRTFNYNENGQIVTDGSAESGQPA